MEAVSPSSLMISPTSLWCPTRTYLWKFSKYIIQIFQSLNKISSYLTSSYIADPDMPSAITRGPDTRKMYPISDSFTSSWNLLMVIDSLSVYFSKSLLQPLWLPNWMVLVVPSNTTQEQEKISTEFWFWPGRQRQWVVYEECMHFIVSWRGFQFSYFVSIACANTSHC